MNSTQKNLMAQFMSEHTDLAKNLLPNCAQGKSTANKLWDELTKKLNAVGPPTKSAKLWKKAYADQKYNAKKKLSFNKASKRRTGGGPYEEKTLTSAEELLVEAAGLEVCVEGDKSVPSFGDILSPVAESSKSDAGSISGQSSRNITPVPVRTPARRTPSTRTYNKKELSDTKVVLLEQNLKATTEHQEIMSAKFDKLLELNQSQVEIQERRVKIEERLLEIKEEKHRSAMAAKEIDYEIKCLELQTLQNNIRK